MHKTDLQNNDKINPILNVHKTVSYTNIKQPHFPNT